MCLRGRTFNSDLYRVTKQDAVAEWSKRSGGGTLCRRSCRKNGGCGKCVKKKLNRKKDLAISNQYFDLPIINVMFSVVKRWGQVQLTSQQNSFGEKRSSRLAMFKSIKKLIKPAAFPLNKNLSNLTVWFKCL